MKKNSEVTPIDRNVTKILIMVAIGVAIATILTACKGCKDQPGVPQPNLVEQLDNEYKPLRDSLAREIEQIRIERDSLAMRVVLLEVEKSKIRVRKDQASGQVAAAEVRKDTVALVLSLKNEISEAEAFIVTQEEQLQVQSAELMKADKEIEKMKQDVFLADQKADRMAKGYNDQEAAFTKTKDELAKSRKETKTAKVWKNIFGGIAVALGVLIVASH